MKKILLVISFTIGMTIKMFGQIAEEQLNVLKDSILKIYEKSKPVTNPIEDVLLTFGYFFSPDNKVLSSIVKSVEAKTNDAYPKVVESIYDSLYTYLIKEVLPEKINKAEQKIKRYGKAVTQKYCDCFNENSNPEPDDEAFSKLNEICNNKVGADTVFLKEMKKLIDAGSPPDETAAQQITSLSLLSGCPIVSNYFKKSANDIYIQLYVSNVEGEMLGIVNKIYGVFPEEKKLIPKLFPEHKKFANELAKTNALANKEGVDEYVEIKNNENGTVSIFKTFYKNSKKDVNLLGQVEYLLNKRSPFAIVLSCKYVMPDKIVNGIKIIESIKAADLLPPPPPFMEELREIKIDTKKRG